jgi:LmbE family N-acetylglucosaminyl deacetylase
MTALWKIRDSTGAVMTRRAALVIAHPDDEALWLSSAIASAERIIFCYGDQFDNPEKAAARRRAIAALPLDGLIGLGIRESGARCFVDWVHPRLTPAGIEIADPKVRSRYEANFQLLIARLRPVLAGMCEVFTHNPWGEYGHPDHIQVHRAVAALQREFGYTIWFTNYVGAASWVLASTLSKQPYWTQRRVVRPDRALARQLMGLYRRHGAWTWTMDHRWPARETVYAMPPADDQQPRYTFSGEWVLDVAGLRWWKPPWRGPRRRLN